jgi:hypothetical protein
VRVLILTRSRGWAGPSRAWSILVTCFGGEVESDDCADHVAVQQRNTELAKFVPEGRDLKLPGLVSASDSGLQLPERSTRAVALVHSEQGRH